MSTMIVETKKLFSRFDAGATTYEQFKECYRCGLGVFFYLQTSFSFSLTLRYLDSRQYFRADDDEIDNILQNIDLDKK